ncbi:LacI family transcriptional regulator [Opitutaceae bacterium TAV5]|nr:LacI family transcriptional regulator [Opitutaceae bacterium TAV5]
MGRRITLKDIAAQCGVSVAAVSYAMRDNPRIPAKTRDAIRRVAEELGYRPDPFLSALVSYRPDVKAQRLLGEVAVIHPCAKDSSHTRLFRFHRESFGCSMAAYGYSVSDFYLDTLGYSSRRLRQILLARNIRGLVLGWGFQPDSLAGFPWQEFVVVSTERVIVHPSIDRISMNHFRSVRVVMERIRAKGHRRIGLIYHDDAPLVVKKNLLGSYLAEMEMAGQLDARLHAFEYTRGESTARFRKWLRASHPDALLSHRSIDPAFFEKAGLAFPQDCGYAVAEIDDAEPGHDAGVYVVEAMGQTLASMLVRKIVTYDNVNMAVEGQIVLVNGVWHDGVTL